MNTTTKTASPYDCSAVARAILKETASKLSLAMMPRAELFPMGSVVLNQLNVFATSTSPSQSLTYPTDGYLVGIRATTEDGLAASMAGVLLRVQVDGREDLFSSGAGNGAGFMPFAMISGQFSQGYWGTRREFLQANAWSVFIQNTTAGLIIADLAFDYVNTRNPTL